MAAAWTDVQLPVDEPFARGPLRRFLAGHAVPGVEAHDPATGTHTRLVPTGTVPALVRVALRDTGPVAAADGGAVVGRGTVEVRLLLDVPAHREPVIARVRAWLGLDDDVRTAGRVLARDPLLAPLVAARPGLRVPGSVDGFETTLFAVLGQQVSLAAARTFAARLLAAYGTLGPGGLRYLPDAARLVAAGPADLQAAVGVTHSRARTLHALASAVADGLRLDRGAEAGATRRQLLALPGIGPWTADYVALRCLGDPDAYLAGDLVLRRVLGVGTAREAEVRAEAWRPWRGHALLHLWTEAVFA